MESLNETKEQDQKKGPGIIWTKQEGEIPVPLFVLLQIKAPSIVVKDEENGNG